MKSIKFILFISLIVILNSCSYKLLPVTISGDVSLDGYKYAYVTPSGEVHSMTGGLVGTQFGTYGSTKSVSTIPSDIIAGVLIKKGFIILPEISPELKSQTFIVNYGKTGRRKLPLDAYTAEIVLQFITADTHQLIFSCTAEGLGKTEADDIRIAIERAFDSIFIER